MEFVKVGSLETGTIVRDVRGFGEDGEVSQWAMVARERDVSDKIRTFLFWLRQPFGMDSISDETFTLSTGEKLRVIVDSDDVVIASGTPMPNMGAFMISGNYQGFYIDDGTNDSFVCLDGAVLPGKVAISDVIQSQGGHVRVCKIEAFEFRTSEAPEVVIDWPDIKWTD